MKIMARGCAEFEIAPDVFGWGGIPDLVVGIGTVRAGPSTATGKGHLTRNGHGQVLTPSAYSYAEGNVHRHLKGSATLTVEAGGVIENKRIIYGGGSIAGPVALSEGEAMRGPMVRGTISTPRPTVKGEGEVSNGFIHGNGKINVRPVVTEGHGAILIHGAGGIELPSVELEARTFYGRHGGGEINMPISEGEGTVTVG